MQATFHTFTSFLGIQTIKMNLIFSVRLWMTIFPIRIDIFSMTSLIRVTSVILYTLDWGGNVHTAQKVKRYRVNRLYGHLELTVEVQGFHWKNICFKDSECCPVELAASTLTLRALISLRGKPFVEGICPALIMHSRGGTEPKWEANRLIIPLHEAWELTH